MGADGKCESNLNTAHNRFTVSNAERLFQVEKLRYEREMAFLGHNEHDEKMAESNTGGV